MSGQNRDKSDKSDKESGSNSAERSPKRYTRGVRASRVALSRALLESGLKTQVALAQRIAEMEGLESPPIDSVSRAFRERSVDPGTVSRIARALAVEPHLLYLSGEQSMLAPSDTPVVAGKVAIVGNVEDATARAQNPDGNNDRLPTSRQVVWCALVVTLLAIAFNLSRANFSGGASSVGASSSSSPSSETTSLSSAVDLSTAPGGVLTVVLAPDASDITPVLLGQLSDHVGDSVRLSLPGAAIPGVKGNPASLRKTLRAHLVLSLSEQHLGRYVAVGLHWTAERGSGVLAAGAGLRVERKQLIQRLGAAAGVSLANLAAGNTPSDGAASSVVPPIAALQSYLSGRIGLDEAGSDASFQQAEASFLSALESSPDWAPAHAGLCEALLFKSWTGNEQEALEEARKHCSRALSLDAADVYVRSAWAHYLRRTGQADRVFDFVVQTPESREPKAKAVAERQLLVNRPRVDSLGQLAEADFALYRGTGDSDHLRRATQKLRVLTELEPDYWRWHSLLATYYYFSQELELSVSAGRAALALEPKPLVFVNLGMAQFCLGDIDGMLESFRSVTALDPSSYFGYEFSGVAQFYLGNHAESTRLRRLALEQIGHSGEPEIHQMWGGLGDALRHDGQTQQALAAYQRAAEILERDFLSGTAAEADRAHRTYYTAVASRLLQGSITVTTDDLERLLKIDLDQSSRVRVAQIAELLGDTATARQQALISVAQCSGLARHPDFMRIEALASL